MRRFLVKHTMNEDNDLCARLQRLHERLVHEITMLKEAVTEEEREGVVNPVETKTIIESLERALHTIHLELQKCPGYLET
jgi:hypothetical protein